MTFPGPLRVFNETVRQGSIRKAGEALSLAPSSISRQIAILERQVGTRLLDRAATGVTLTHAGKLVADFSQSVLIDYDSLRSDLDDLKGQRRGLIRIASVESIAATLPVRTIAAYRKRFGEIEFQIKVLPAPAVPAAVLHGEVDIGVSFCPEPDAALTSVARVKEPIVAALPLGHALCGRGTVSIADLARFDLAVPDKDFGVRRILERAFHAAGTPLSPVMSSNSFTPLREAVAAAGVIALLPQASLQGGDHRFEIASIAQDELNSTFIDVLVLSGRRQSLILRRCLSELKALVASS